MSRLLRFIIAVGLPLAAGFVGSVFTSPAIPDWYAGLEKPVFSPPNWLFAPVWTLLYILMGISFYRILSLQQLNDARAPAAKAAVTVFLVHLAVNLLWSVLFFGLRNPLLGLIDILILLILIAVVIQRFYRLDRTAAYLLLPYLAWVTFATLLNFSIWRLN